MSYDKKFYQNVINTYENDNSIEITDIYSSKVNEDGENFLSEALSVKLIGKKDNKDYKRYLIVKIIPKQSLFFENVIPIAFRNECIAYKEIVPTLNSFAKRPFSVPECLHCDENIIILDDLRTKGYDVIDKVQGFSTEQLENVVKEIANIHAASLIMEHKQPEFFQQFSNRINDFFTDSNQMDSKLEQFYEINLQMAINLLNPTTESKIIETLNKLKGNFLPTCHEALDQKSEIRVINHGDLWANNILFDKNGNIKLIDLQGMRYASFAADLSYFFYVNILTPKRQQIQDHLLNIYLTELKACLEGAKIPIYNILTIQFIKKEMEKYRTFGMLYGLLFLTMFVSKHDQEIYYKSITPPISGPPVLSEEHKRRILDLVREYGSSL